MTCHVQSELPLLGEIEFLKRWWRPFISLEVSRLRLFPVLPDPEKAQVVAVAADLTVRLKWHFVPCSIQ